MRNDSSRCQQVHKGTETINRSNHSALTAAAEMFHEYNLFMYFKELYGDDIFFNFFQVFMSWDVWDVQLSLSRLQILHNVSPHL